MLDILVIGAGNLAWHLVQILQKAGHDVGLVSRDPARVAEWPVRVVPISDIEPEPDLVFLTVPDDAIAQASTELSLQLAANVPMVHTSGATPVTTINPYFKRRGALWPIRSLRAGEPVSHWRDLPLVYYGTDAALTQVLGKLSGELSDLSYELDDDQRAKLHLAAVFSNNFVNSILQISYDLCQNQGLPFGILTHLFQKHAMRLNDQVAPKTWQTGPAVRNDTTTLSNQINLLEDPVLKELYAIMTSLIQNQR